MASIYRRIRVLAIFGWLLAAMAVVPYPTAADGIENGRLVPNPGVPQGNAVEPVRPQNLVFIDFDEIRNAPCLFGETWPLRDDYQGLGVRFSGPGGVGGGAILDECGNFGVSGYSAPNFVAFNRNGVMRNGEVAIGPERMTFLIDVTTVQVGVAGPGGVATLRAYDSSSNLLATASASVPRSMLTLLVASPGIRYADLEVVGARDDVWVFDNLAFDTQPTGAIHQTWGRIKQIYR